MEQEDVLRKVRALLDRADHPNTPEAEADTCRNKADSLMLSYAIESWQIPDAGGQVRTKPELRDYMYGDLGDQEANDYLSTIFYSLCDLCGAKLGFYGWRSSKIVGYPADLDYLDMLFTGVRLHLSANVAPQPDKSLGVDANVIALKEAGLKWQDIHSLLVKADILPDKDLVWSRTIGTRWTKLYTRHCQEAGKERVYASPTVWRRSFLAGYSDEIRQRIFKMKARRQEETEEGGYGIVLRNRDGDLMEALYEWFPDKRPHAPDCSCNRCHPTGKYKPVRRSTYTAPTLDSAAIRRGRKAGSEADLSGGRNNVGSRKEIG